MGQMTSQQLDRGDKSGVGLLPLGRGRTVLVALFALAGGFLATAAFGDATGSVLAAAVGMFAMLGLYAAVLAIRRASKGEGEAEDHLGRAAFAASADAMAVVENGERVVEANEPYRSLGPSGAAELPTPQSFLARIPGSQPAVTALLNAVAEARPLSQSLPYDAADPARRLEVRIEPMNGARRVLWSLRFPPATVSTTPAAPAQQVAAAPMPETVSAEADESQVHGDQVVEAWEQAPAGIVRLSSTAAMLPNVSLCRLLGYGLAEWPPAGMALEEMVAPEHLGVVRAALAPGAAAAGLPVSLQVGLVRRDATHLPVLLRLGAPDASGASTAVVIPEDALPLAAATAPGAAGGVDGERFFLRAPLALALVDGQGRIRAANAAFDRLFAVPAATRSAETTLAALTAERDGEAVTALLAGARAGGAAPCEVAPRAEGGRMARLYAAALGGDEIALCAIDTTEQKALEAQFAQSQKLQAVGHLAGGVAHDFNNMLTAIIGYCDLLLAKHRPSDPSFPDIMQIKQNANRAAGLVRQLLAFSRRQTLRPQVIELNDVLADVSELLRRLIGERIALEVEHGRDLWPVKVDVNQFEQVIINLAVNARDAMPDGGTLIVRTRNVPADACATYAQGSLGDLAPADYVMVEVEDTGTGIPKEIMDKIFEPFFSTKEVGKGTGLGLSTVYGILQQTGGTILASSVEGQGTTFRVFLPRHHASAEDEAPAKEPEAKAADLTGQGTILLVEDEDAVRAFASRALMGRGYDVLTAASGVEALTVMAEAGRKVDLVVSDVVMPEMDGPTLLKELRARDPHLKVIFISGYAEEAFARNLPPSENFSFLPKPFSLKQLVAAVAEALRS